MKLKENLIFSKSEDIYNILVHQYNTKGKIVTKVKNLFDSVT